MKMRDKKYLVQINFVVVVLITVYHFVFIPQERSIKEVAPKQQLSLRVETIPTNFTIENEEEFTSLKKGKYKSKKPTDDYEEEEEKDVKWKKIVFWTDYFGEKEMWPKVFKRLQMGECEESRCNISIKESEVYQADAVIFNAYDLQKQSFSLFDKWYKNPSHRHPDQIYVFFSMEAPPVVKNVQLDAYNNFFNWTMTYRTDSDIVIPYGKIRKRQKLRRIKDIPYKSQEELDAKNMAIWMVSDCKTQSKREEFVKELRRYLPIDTFGGCSKNKCGQRTTIRNIDKLDDDPCLPLIANYSFFLALENSLCTDYVTEKLYRSLKLGIVPITLGAVNYTAIAPPNSFIDPKDFTTFIDLASHIKKIKSEVGLYNEYLDWQREYDIELGSPYKPFVCDLCKKLHKPRKSLPKTYKNIKDWYVAQGPCYKFSS